MTGRFYLMPAFGCHACFAGMDCLNHWIPACAGMTQGVASGFYCHDERAASDFYPNDEGGCGQIFVRHGKGTVGLATNLFSLRCHSGEGRNPGRALPGCLYARRLFPFAPNVLSRHPRYAGMYSRNHWIPACAGMTQPVGVHPFRRAFAGMTCASSP